MSVEDLAREVGVKGRALRLWMKAGILPKPQRRRRWVYFGEREQLRARAAAALLKKMRRLTDVASALAGLDDAALRKIAGLPEPIVASPEPEPAPIAPPTAEEPEPASDDSNAAPGWRSIALVPGLELRVQDDAPPFVQRIADAIVRGDWLT